MMAQGGVWETMGKETHDFKATAFIRGLLWAIKSAAKMEG